MELWQLSFDRRTFLKLQALLLGWALGIQSWREASAQNRLMVAEPAPYGKGAYSVGASLGNQKLYLPLIHKEEN